MTKDEMINATRHLYGESSVEFLQKEITHCEAMREFHTIRIATLKKMIKEKESNNLKE